MSTNGNTDTSSTGKVPSVGTDESIAQDAQSAKGKAADQKANITVYIKPSDQKEFYIKNNALGMDLFDQVVAALNIKEPSFFGLEFTAEDGQPAWLRLRKKVFSQGVSKKQHLVVWLKPKYYPEDAATELTSEISMSLFYHFTKDDILGEQIYCPADIAVLLASYSLQVDLGNYDHISHTPGYLTKEKILPMRVLEQYEVTKQDWENHVTGFYKDHYGMEKKDAMLFYLKVAQELDMYSVQYVPITNKKGTELFLGISTYGISIYEKDNKLTPKTSFQWREIHKVSYQRKKFTVKPTDSNSPNVIFCTDSDKINKNILTLCVGNFELYKRRLKAKAIAEQMIKDNEIAKEKQDVSNEESSYIEQIDKAIATEDTEMNDHNAAKTVAVYQYSSAVATTDHSTSTDELDDRDVIQTYSYAKIIQSSTNQDATFQEITKNGKAPAPIPPTASTSVENTKKDVATNTCSDIGTGTNTVSCTSTDAFASSDTDKSLYRRVAGTGLYMKTNETKRNSESYTTTIETRSTQSDDIVYATTIEPTTSNKSHTVLYAAGATASKSSNAHNAATTTDDVISNESHTVLYAAGATERKSSNAQTAATTTNDVISNESHTVLYAAGATERKSSNAQNAATTTDDVISNKSHTVLYATGAIAHKSSKAHNAATTTDDVSSNESPTVLYAAGATARKSRNAHNSATTTDDVISNKSHTVLYAAGATARKSSNAQNVATTTDDVFSKESRMTQTSNEQQAATARDIATSAAAVVAAKKVVAAKGSTETAKSAINSNGSAVGSKESGKATASTTAEMMKNMEAESGKKDYEIYSENLYCSTSTTVEEINRDDLEINKDITPEVKETYGKLKVLFEDISRKERLLSKEDIIHRGNRDAGLDKYQTLRRIYKGYTRERVAQFEGL